MRIGALPKIILSSGIALAAACGFAEEPAAPPALRVLFVTADAERGGRFREFLQSEGMACDIAAYGATSPEAACAYDVLVADTPARSSNDVIALAPQVAGFPEAPRPVVAIGFLGVQFLKTHRTAIGDAFL